MSIVDPLEVAKLDRALRGSRWRAVSTGCIVHIVALAQVHATLQPVIVYRYGKTVWTMPLESFKATFLNVPKPEFKCRHRGCYNEGDPVTGRHFCSDHAAQHTW